LATAHLAAGGRPEAREAAEHARVVAEGEGDGAGRDEADRLLRVIAGTDAAPPSP
jgi:hypothetical protein